MFCGASRMTKTHLIAQRAIRRHLPESSLGTGRYDRWLDATGSPQYRRQDYNFDPLAHQVKRACDACNRGWMGGVENEVAADVIALAKGDVVALDAKRSTRLAVWATIVAMLRSTQDPGKPNFDPEDAKIIRKTSALPPGYVVWLLSGEARWDFPTRHQRINIAVGGRPYQPTHVTWFWIGHAVFMVNHPEAAPILSRLDVFREAVQILAPHGGYPIVWPFRTEVKHQSMVDVTSTFFRV